VAPTDRAHPGPIGTWTIDPAHSSVIFAWRKLRLWTITGRLHCRGIIHLDDLPPVGVIRFQQSSGLPVLTIALDPASVEAKDADTHAMPCGPDVVDVLRHRRWTLRSESLEILPTGTWRIMATLTANGTERLVELHLAVDPKASNRDRLVLRGRKVPDRRASGIDKRAWLFDPEIQFDLATPAAYSPADEHATDPMDASLSRRDGAWLTHRPAGERNAATRRKLSARLDGGRLPRSRTVRKSGYSRSL
jgi:polyisoprenoid-binding protein YceI